MPTQVVCIKAPVDAAVPYPDGRKGPDRKVKTYLMALHEGNQYDLPSGEATRLIEDGFCVKASEPARKRAAKAALVAPPTAAGSSSGGPGDEADVESEGREGDGDGDGQDDGTGVPPASDGVGTGNGDGGD